MKSRDVARIPEPTERDRRRSRRPTLASAIKQARKLGLPVSSATLTTEGVSLTFGEPGMAESPNPWDREHASR